MYFGISVPCSSKILKRYKKQDIIEPFKLRLLPENRKTWSTLVKDIYDVTKAEKNLSFFDRR